MTSSSGHWAYIHSAGIPLFLIPHKGTLQSYPHRRSRFFGLQSVSAVWTLHRALTQTRREDPIQPTYAGKPKPTGRFQDVSYARSEENRGPQFQVAIELTEPVDDTWLSLFENHAQGLGVEWDEEAPKVSTLNAWTPVHDVTPTLNKLNEAIIATNEKYATIEKLKPTLEAELEMWVAATQGTLIGTLIGTLAAPDP